MKIIKALNIVSRNVLWTQDTRTFTCGHSRTCPNMSRTRHLRVLFEKKSDMSLKDISI